MARGNDTTIDASRIIDSIWVGSAPPLGCWVMAHGFDAVVLCAEEFQPSHREFCGARTIHAPLDDAPDAGTEELRVAMQAAREVARIAAGGGRVLVTCMMGRNRSALVATMALYMLGMGRVPMRSCISSVRKRRTDATGTPALQNKAFVRLLLAYEQLAMQDPT